MMVGTAFFSVNKAKKGFMGTFDNTRARYLWTLQVFQVVYKRQQKPFSESINPAINATFIYKQVTYMGVVIYAPAAAFSLGLFKFRFIK